MRISVVGLGKAGLPLAAVIADAGMDIVGLDTDESRIAMINEKKNPIPEEPGLKEIIEQRIGVNFHATSSYEEAVKSSDVHIVIVPLFIDDEHRPDFSILDSAFESVGKNMKKGDLVVLETTVPVGTTKGRIKDLLEKASGLTAGSDFFLAYSPERIMTGHSISRYKEFPKVVGGIDKESTDKAFDIYSKFCGKVDKVSDSNTAELIKVSEGVYRDVNIALANELLKVCNRYGVDFWEMREKANHQFCNILEPGNVGGHCIPVYPWFLINDNDVPLIKEARLLNDDMIKYYLEQVKKISTKGKVCIVGLSYRTGVKEKAYARSIPFIKILKEEGYEVYGIDEMYSDDELEEEFGVQPSADLSKMDVIVLFNKIESYEGKLEGICSKVVDVRNSLEANGRK